MADHFALHGWASHLVITPELADRLAEIVRQEALYMVFQDKWDVLQKMAAKGINPSQLLTDNKLRAEWLSDNPKMVWWNNNPNTPKISASCGMVNIYCQPQIREHVLFNLTVIECLRAFYKTLPEATSDERLIYGLGPDRVGLKAKGAKDMDRHIDSNPFVSPSQQSPHYRVQSFVTLRVATPDTTEKKRGKLGPLDVGSIEVLEGFHHYYELAGWYFKQEGMKPFTGNGPYDFKELSKSLLPKFITWVKDYIYSEVAKPELKAYLTTLPKEYVPMRWVAPILKPGELFAFDSRLPHRNTRNKSDVERIVAYVSLYRQADFGKVDVMPMFKGETKSKHKGSNRDNAGERETFKDMWNARVDFRTDDPLVREVLGLPSLKPPFIEESPKGT